MLEQPHCHRPVSKLCFWCRMRDLNLIYLKESFKFYFPLLALKCWKTFSPAPLLYLKSLHSYPLSAVCFNTPPSTRHRINYYWDSNHWWCDYLELAFRAVKWQTILHMFSDRSRTPNPFWIFFSEITLREINSCQERGLASRWTADSVLGGSHCVLECKAHTRTSKRLLSFLRET